MGLQNNLGISFPSTSFQVVLSRGHPSLNTTEWSRVCSVISAYRLLDVVAIVDGANQAASVERSSMANMSASLRVSVTIYILFFL